MSIAIPPGFPPALWLGRERPEPAAARGVAARIAPPAEEETGLYDAATRASEDRYRRLIEDAPLGILIHQDRVPVFANRAAVKMLGYDGAQEILALGDMERIFAPGEHARLRAYQRARREGGEAPRQYEFEARRRDGSSLIVHTSVCGLTWKGAFATEHCLVDVTARRRAEDERGRLLDALGERVKELTVLHESWRLLQGQGGCTQRLLAGIGRALVAGLRRPEAGVARVTYGGVRVCTGIWRETPWREVASFRTGDGTEGILEVAYLEPPGPGMEACFLDEERRVLESLAEMLRSHFQRRTAEQALRESEERFRDFAEVSADWFWETDAELRFTHVSGPSLDVLGVSEDALLGRRIREQLRAPGAVPDPVLDTFLSALDRHEVVEAVDLRFDSPDGDVRWLRVAGKPVFDARGGFRGYRCTGRDVTRERLLAERLEHQASHDQLTGLRNRRAFEAHLQELLAGERETAEEHVLCYLDLDQFKVVNDTCGHAAGDLLLQRVAGLLRARLRRGDTIARLGGDEFGVVLEHCPLEEGRRITESLREMIAEEPFVYGDRGFRITASIGLVPLPGGAESVAELLGRADAACYAAKDFGRNRVHGFEADDAELARRRGEMQWVSRIHEALERDRFRLYAQPIVARSPDSVPGAHLELLLRLAAESGEELPPGAFLPAAERYHLSPLIDRWVVERALAWLGEDRERLARIGLCWINLSALSVGDDAFARFLTGCFHRTGVPPAKVCFEITETAAIANLGTAGRLIRELRGLGCRIALDDFGSGLSSYGYLKSLPVDYLKIDGGFVRDILEDPVSHATVRSINEIGHVMGKQTVAEFVENEAILAVVAALGVDYVQGYGVGHPVPLESLDLLAGGPGFP